MKMFLIVKIVILKSLKDYQYWLNDMLQVIKFHLVKPHVKFFYLIFHLFELCFIINSPRTSKRPTSR